VEKISPYRPCVIGYEVLLCSFDIIQNLDLVFPPWVDAILFPGYFLGLVMGFGGDVYALTGQLVTLFFLTVFVWLMLRSLKPDGLHEKFC
jgi:hypothetical protein